jgi:hypothetical protein
MGPGASTPEELETLLEDALLIRDHEAVIELFEDGAVLDPGGGLPEARGADHIATLASALWERTFVADPRRVLQARDTALVVGEWGINVARRGADGAWRYAISLLSPDHEPTKEEQ